MNKAQWRSARARSMACLVAAAFPVAMGSGQRTARADAWVWTGGASNTTTQWSATGNWVRSPSNFSLSIVPISTGDAALNFTGISGNVATEDLANPFTLNSIFLDSSLGGFTMGGSGLKFVANSNAIGPQIFQNSASQILIHENLTLAADLSLAGSGTGQMIFDGVVDGTGAMVKTGTSNVLMLTNGAAWKGRLEVNQGMVTVAVAGALTVNNPLVVNTGSSTGLTFSPAAVTVGSLAGNGNVSLQNTKLTVGGNNTSTTYSGVLSANSGGLIKTGSGALTLSGTGSSIGGPLSVAAGVVLLSGGSFTDTMDALGNVDVAANSFLLLGSGAHLNMPSGLAVVHGFMDIHDGGSTFTTGGQVSVGPDSVGGVTVNNGSHFASAIVMLGQNAGSDGRLLVDTGGTAQVDFLHCGWKAGSLGALTAQGAGAQTTITSLLFGENGHGGGAVVVKGGATIVAVDTLIDTADTTTFSGNIIVNGGTFTTGSLRSSGPYGVVNLQADPTDGPGLIINGSSGTSTYSGAIIGAGSILKQGGGTQVLAGAGSADTGATRVIGGTLRSAANNAIGAGLLSVQSGATVDLNGFSQKVSSLLGNGAITLGSGTNTLTVGGYLDTVYTGSISGGGTAGLLKVGSGSLTLKGNTTIGGTAFIDQHSALILDGGNFTSNYNTIDSLVVLNGSSLVAQNGAHLVTTGGPEITVDGTALVTGAGTTWGGYSQIGIGGFGTGTLTVQNGATVGANTQSYLLLGAYPGSHGTVSVQGGGLLFSTEAVLGYGASSQGSVAVTGAGSHWQTTEMGLGGFFNAQGGSGDVLVSAGGWTEVVDATTFWNPPGATPSSITINGGAYTTLRLTSVGVGGSINLQADFDATTPALQVLGNSAKTTAFSGQITGPGTMLKFGKDTLIIAANENFGAVRVGNVGALEMRGNLTVATTTIDSFATLRLASGAGGTRVLRTSALSITGGGRLDLGDNKLIVHGNGDAGTWAGSAYAGTTGLIASGRKSGAWTGSGIVTSQSRALTGNFTTLGIATASQVKGIAASATGTWAGQAVTGSDTLVMYTYGGDANLDGKINVDDYTRIDFNVSLGSSGWYNGDFNYDGKINVDDYTIIDFNVGIQGSPFATAAETEGTVPGASAWQDASTLQGVSAVPEPSGAAILGVALALSSRCRRNRKE